MPPDDAGVARADHARGLDKEHLAQGQHLGAHHAGEGEPRRDREDDDEIRDARPHDGRDRDGKDQCRDRLLDVRDAHDDAIPSPAQVSRDEPERDADPARERDAHEAHGERHARSVDHAGEEVAPEAVRAEQMAVLAAGQRRRVETLEQLLRVRAGRDLVGEKRREHERREDREAE